MEEDFDVKYNDKNVKQRLFASSSQIIIISDALNKIFYEKYRVTTKCIHNGVIWNNLLVQNKKRYIYHVIITGTIYKGKGQIDAVRAIKILRDRGINIHLTIVGCAETSYLWLINKYISKYNLLSQVTVFGFVENLSELRLDANLSLTCSRFEALGRCTIEAMMEKKFVIGTDTAGIAEIVGYDGSKGLLYTYGKPQELADRIEEYVHMSSE